MGWPPIPSRTHEHLAQDTAASISILTSEFIKDVGALDLTEAIAYGNNVEMELPDGNAASNFSERS